MKNYLSALKGDSSLETSDTDDGFKPFLEGQQDVASNLSPSDEVKSEESQIIYDQSDCPKVEVVNIDGKPSRIIIHLPDGKRLEISCEY